jgi:hypothetical protein
VVWNSVHDFHDSLILHAVLMYLHRSFFAQAIIDNPDNPLKSPYAHSFLSSFKAAGIILKSIKDQFNVWPNTCARFWVMWTFAFTAAVGNLGFSRIINVHYLSKVVFGTVATRGPKSPLANTAVTELDQACLLFSKAAAYSKRAKKALVLFLSLEYQ